MLPYLEPAPLAGPGEAVGGPHREVDAVMGVPQPDLFGRAGFREPRGGELPHGLQQSVADRVAAGPDGDQRPVNQRRQRREVVTVGRKRRHHVQVERAGRHGENREQLPLRATEQAVAPANRRLDTAVAG